ncbi:Glycosyltransferase involved in cell wall bisynthesis [Brevinema andersonii]|uniref:Glycosyltransferase involved in cell wall bisynthesis n=1 Tax=Brevinema andersonii TaxID=34097 RepID=A0A1I1EUM4_BREAD|nr:glycosyltransferase family 2 protein [Brevinema andersonii]SFB90875.1 Glycosyltransferase involved in cell wall bisynthesis [Brevinema andersonii]
MYPKISIIIPVYNTEEFLEECIHSCINQTLHDIEIIIINDNSPGNCREIVKKFQQLDSRIKFIDLPKNMGTLNTRIQGYKIAQGEFIQNVDSDDSLKPEACQIIYHKLTEFQADICHINPHLYLHPDKSQKAYNKIFTPQKCSLTQKKWIEKLLTKKLDNCMCFYIIKRSLINNLIPMLPENQHIILYEDLLQIFSLAFSISVNKIISIPDQLYWYRCNVGIMSKTLDIELFKKKIANTIQVTSTIINIFNKNIIESSPETSQKLHQYLFEISVAYFNIYFSMNKEEQIQIQQYIIKHGLQNEFIYWLTEINNNESLISDTATLSINEKRIIKLYRSIKNMICSSLPNKNIVIKIIRKKFLL